MNQLIQTINSIPWPYLFIFGFLIGLLVGFVLNRAYKVGIIHIKPGNEEKPDNYFFEFNVHPAVIREKKKVEFSIAIETEDQQKIQSV